MTMNTAGMRVLTYMDCEPIVVIRMCVNDGALFGWKREELGDPRTGWKQPPPLSRQFELLREAANELLRRAVMYRPVVAGSNGALVDGPAPRPGWIPEGHHDVSHDEGCLGIACTVLGHAIARVPTALAGVSNDALARERDAWRSVLREALLGIAESQVGYMSEPGICGLWTQSPRRSNTSNPGGAVLWPGALSLNDHASLANVMAMLMGILVLGDGDGPRAWMAPVVRRAGAGAWDIAENNWGLLPEACDGGGAPVWERPGVEPPGLSYRATGEALQMLLAFHAVGDNGFFAAAAAGVLRLSIVRGKREDGTWPHRVAPAPPGVVGRPVYAKRWASVPTMTYDANEGASYTSGPAGAGSTGPAAALAVMDRYLAASAKAV